MKRYVLSFLGTMALMALSLAVVFAIQDSGTGVAGDPTPVPHFDLADARIEITSEPVLDRGQEPVPVQVEFGVIPNDVSVVTVLTDEDCMPDAEGVSHCINRVHFSTSSGTQQAVLRHHHKMSEAPCLTPGQTLEVVR